MPDYTYTQIFPNLAETQHDLEVWLSHNVVNEEEGNALWSLVGHTHADALQIDSDQATGWTLPTTIGEITSYTLTSGLETLEATDSVLVDVTAVAQASGLAAGKGLTLRIALQDVLQDQTITFYQPGSGTASGTSGAGSSHTHAVTGNSAGEGAHTHDFADTSTGNSRTHWHSQDNLVTAAAGGHTHAADGSHTHGGTGAGSAHSHSYSLTASGSHRHTDPVSGYTGYATHDHTSSTNTESSHTHSIASGGSHDHDTIADHTHTITGDVGEENRNHTHNVSGTSAAGTSHLHAVSLTSAAEAAHTHSFSSAHSHTVGYVAGSLRCVASVVVGAGKSVKVSLYANTETTTATVDKVSFDGLVWVIPTSLAAQLGGIDDLADVDVPAPSDGQVLTWSSATSEWIASDVLGSTPIGDLSDVTIDGAPANHELLTFDSTTSQWVNHTAAEAGLSETGHNHDASYLGISAKAADSDLLDGHDTAYFSVDGHNHDASYSALGHDHDATYLGIAAQAADSDTVDGQHAAAFAAAVHNHDADYSDIAHAHSVEDLDNVTITDVQDGEALTWDEGTSKWVNAAPAAASILDDVGDVTITAASDGDVLSWDAGTANWINVTPEAAAMGNLEDIADVTITTPADNEVLAYDVGSGEWINQTAAEAGLATDAHNHDAAYISIVGTPTEGNFPQLTAGGELANSVYDETSFATSGHNHDSAYISVVGTPTEGNFPQLTAGGELVNSIYDETSFATAAHTHAAHALDDLSDVEVAAPALGHVIIYQTSPTSRFINYSLNSALEALSKITNLNDVTQDGTPADNEVLAYNTATSVWTNQTAAEAGLATSGHTHTLDDLSNVDAATVTAGNVVRADGTDWHSATLALTDLSDVTTTTPTSGNVLSADGTDWDSRTLAEAGIAAASHTHLTQGSWTPTYTCVSGGNPTMTHDSGQYSNAQGMCIAHSKDTFTATVGGGIYQFTLPVDVLTTSATAAASTNATVLGTAYLIDTSTGTTYVGVVTLKAVSGTDLAHVVFASQTARWTYNGSPITIASGDVIAVNLCYPTA
jgi:hypothetical protein